MATPMHGLVNDDDYTIIGYRKPQLYYVSSIASFINLLCMKSIVKMKMAWMLFMLSCTGTQLPL